MLRTVLLNLCKHIWSVYMLLICYLQFSNRKAQWATVVVQKDAIDLYSLYKGGRIWGTGKLTYQLI